MAGQIGLEPTPEAFVATLVEVFRGVRRVLRDDGTLWVNIGDCYAGSGKGTGKAGTIQGKSRTWGDEAGTPTGTFAGIKAKDMIGIPWMLAFALRADGWYLRSDIIWDKPAPMPESVKDRPTSSHEHLFLLSKSRSYFYDGDAIREPYNEGSAGRYQYSLQNTTPTRRQPGGDAPDGMRIQGMNPLGRGKRDVWRVASVNFTGAHFATFPPKLILPCILAGTSEKGGCPVCGAPWRRVVEVGGGTIGKGWNNHKDDLITGHRASNDAKGGHGYYRSMVGWEPTCQCGKEETVPQTVLDPFVGSGTTLLVATRHGRSAIGCELNPTYAADARARIRGDAPLWNIMGEDDGQRDSYDGGTSTPENGKDERGDGATAYCPDGSLDHDRTLQTRLIFDP